MTDRSPERAGGTPAEPDDSGLPLWWIVSAAAVIAVLSALAGAILALFAERGHPALAGIGPTVVAVAEMPKTLKDAVEHAGDPTRDLRVHRTGVEDQNGFDFAYAPGAWAQAPYLLVNRYDSDRRRSVSELVDLRSQEMLHRWDFDVDPIWRDTDLDSRFVDLARDENTVRFRNFHTLLDADGSVVTKSGLSPLVRMDLCGKVDWVNDDHVFHHSIERDEDGFYWVPIHIEPRTVAFGSRLFMDDGLARVDPDGNVVETRSVAQILAANGLEVYMRGMGHELEDDPVHLNDIQPVLEDGEIWRKGDVWLSLRNRSMVALYRPETDEILWWHIGPWIHQHDVNVLDERRITVFDNNSKKAGAAHIDNVSDDVSGVWIVDVVENDFQRVYPEAFEALDIRASHSGRGRLMEDGSLFVEEGTVARLVVIGPDGAPRLSYVNRAADGELYRLNWSRIVDRETGDAVRARLATGICDD